MTAEEIRALPISGSQDVRILREIAAQLAEMNAFLVSVRSVVDIDNMPDAPPTPALVVAPLNTKVERRP